MKVTIDIPEPLASNLADRAEALDLPIEAIVLDALAYRSGSPTSKRLTWQVQQRIGALVRNGYCDADIATMTHYVVGYVALVRRSLHLPANPRYRRINTD